MRGPLLRHTEEFDIEAIRLPDVFFNGNLAGAILVFFADGGEQPLTLVACRTSTRFRG